MAKVNSKHQQQLLRFNELCRKIHDSTVISEFESDAEKNKRICRLRKDYAAFVDYYFPHYAQSKCGWFHIEAAKEVKKQKRLRLCLEWARGHAKSTHANILFPLWLKMQEPKEIRVMVLVGKNEDAAQTLLSDLQAELISNQRYINDFGEQLRFGSWEKGRFATKDDCAFFALGRGQSPRGLRYRQYRPDYFVLDDIDDDELCRNPKRVNQTYDWALKALLGSSDMGNCRFIIANNRIAKHTVLGCFTENESFNTIRVNALDTKGQVEWKEKYAFKEVDLMIRDLGYAKAQSELFNNPIIEGAVFKTEWLQYRNSPDLSEYDYIVSYCDPSFKNTDTSDYKAIITIGKKDAVFDIIATFVRKCSIHEMVTYWYDYYETIREKAIVDFFMEGGLLQDMIFDEFTKEGKIRGYQLPMRKDSRKKPDKHARIEAVPPLFERGFIFIDNSIKDNTDCKLLLDQLLSFEKGNRGHDDAPDAMEGALFILNQRGKRLSTGFRSGGFKKNTNRSI